MDEIHFGSNLTHSHILLLLSTPYEGASLTEFSGIISELECSLFEPEKYIFCLISSILMLLQDTIQQLLEDLQSI